MLQTSSRLLRLIALLQSRRYWPGAELAERLQVDARTLRRDIGRLRELGYPVKAAAGVGGGYQLGAGSDTPPLLFDDEEAVAVAVALRAAAGSIGGIEDTAVRLPGKLDQLLPARLRRRATALHSVMISLGGDVKLPEAEILTRAAAACRDQQCLSFRYSDRGGKASLRRVEPLRLANYGRRWYLVAWDRDRDDWRTFRVDRMQMPVGAGDRFTPREPPGDLSAYVTRAISYAPFSRHVTLRLAGPAAAMAERVPRWCGVIEAVDDKSCLLRMGGETPESLLSQLLFTGVAFELVEPAEMKQEFRAILERLATMVG